MAPLSSVDALGQAGMGLIPCTSAGFAEFWICETIVWITHSAVISAEQFSIKAFPFPHSVSQQNGAGQ